MSGVTSDQGSGFHYTAEFLWNHSNGELTVCSQACQQLGLCRTNQNYTYSKKRRGTKGKLRGCKSIKCCLLNSRSVTNKTVLIQDIIVENYIDIAIITETWNPKRGTYYTTINELCPDKYKCISQPRNGRGGSIAIIYRETLNMHAIDTQSFQISSYEQLSVYVSDCNNTNKQLLVAIYRPPSKPLNKFIDELQEHLNELRLHSGIITLLGDFNIHLDETTPTTTTLHSILEAHDLSLNTTPATHTKGHCLDAVATEYPIKVKVHDPSISDHYILLFHLKRLQFYNRVPKPGAKNYHTIRNLRNVDMKSFTDELEQILDSGSSKLNECTLPSNVFVPNVHTECDYILNSLTDVLDRLAPLTKKKCNSRKIQFDLEVANAKRLRRKLERKFMKSHLSTDKQLLCEQNKTVSKLVKKARGNCYSTMISEAQSQSKALFRVVFTLSTDCRMLRPLGSDEHVAERFASFFGEKVHRIVALFPPIQAGHIIGHFTDFQFSEF